MLAEIDKWSDDEKASFLAISLRGPTLTVVTNLPSRDAALTLSWWQHWINDLELHTKLS